MKDLVTAVKRKGKTRFIEYRLKESENILILTEDELLELLRSGEEIKHCKLEDDTIKIDDSVIKLTLTKNSETLETLLQRKDMLDFWNYNLNLVNSNEVSMNSKEDFRFKCDKGHVFLEKPINICHRKDNDLCPECKTLRHGSKVAQVAKPKQIYDISIYFNNNRASAILSGMLRYNRSILDEKADMSKEYTYKCRLGHEVTGTILDMVTYRRKKQCICNKCIDIADDILDCFLYNIFKIIFNDDIVVNRNYLVNNRAQIIKFTLKNNKLLIHCTYKRVGNNDFRLKIAEHIQYRYTSIFSDGGSIREIEADNDIETLDAIYEKAKNYLALIKINETLLEIEPDISKKIEEIDTKELFYKCASEVENDQWDTVKIKSNQRVTKDNYKNNTEEKVKISSNVVNKSEKVMTNNTVKNDYELEPDMIGFKSFSDYTLDEKFDLIMYEGRQFKTETIQNFLVKFVYFLYMTDFVAFAKVVEDPLLRYEVYDREFRIVSTKHYEIKTATNIANTCIYVDTSFPPKRVLKYLKRIIDVAGINIKDIKYRKVNTGK